MLHIIQLFGRSPFAPLQSHMEKVTETIYCLPKLFQALIDLDKTECEKVANSISELEHSADLMKNDIRNHLSGSTFMTIDRSVFLEMISLQDRLADSAEDVAVLVTLRPMQLLQSFKDEYLEFLAKNIECFEAVREIIQEIHELVESSFGGAEAEKVKAMWDRVVFLEHEADVMQIKLLKALYASEPELSYGLFFQWQKVFEATASIANLSEKLANCVRMTLDIQ